MLITRRLVGVGSLVAVSALVGGTAVAVTLSMARLRSPLVARCRSPLVAK
jgi:hypothetical protein